jgi:hypothetical protein
MADATDIKRVVDNIELAYEEYGWDNTEISTRLDAGDIWQRVVATYWRQRASATLLLVNTSEAGSSRGLDSVYPRMIKLAEDWEARADLIENPVSEAADGRLSSFPIKRV